MSRTPDVLLRTTDDLDTLLADPSPVLIFKHSTRCPISTHAHEQFLAWLQSKQETPRTALIRVVEERPLSLEIASRLAIPHQSPQAILVQDGSTLWNASHDQITLESLTQATT